MILGLIEGRTEMPHGPKHWSPGYLSDDDPTRRRKSELASVAWHLSVVFGSLAGLLIVLTGLLLLFEYSPSLKVKVMSVLPAPVAKWLSEPGRATPEDPGKKSRATLVEEFVEKVVPPPKPARSVPRVVLGLGMHKDEVRRIQGQPTAISSDVWTYGKSQVYFVNDRLVGWRVDPAFPLRVP